MGFPRYEKYKDSGVEWLGEVPEHWAIKRVRHILKPSYEGLKIGPFGSQLTTPMLVESGWKVYGQENVIANDYNRGERFIPEDKFNELSVYEIKAGDILITMMGTTGRCGIAPDNIFQGIMDSHLLRIRVKDEIKPTFFQILIDESNYVSCQIQILGKGSIMHGLNSSIVKELILAIPPVIEQKSLIYFLKHETAKIDDLIAEQQKLIELLKEKRQAVISHAVTKGLNPDAKMKDSGIEWLGEVPEHWVTVPIKLFISTRKGVAFKAQDFKDEGVAVVKASDIKNLTIQTPDVFLPKEFLVSFPKAVLKTGDIILSTVGSTPDVVNSAVGQIAKLPPHLDGCMLNQNTVVFTPDSNKLKNDFLFYLVRTSRYREHLNINAHGTANQASLNIQDMLGIYFVIPPFDEQSQITNYLGLEITKLDTLISEAQKAITLLQERRTALISAAVTGKIDVRGFVSESENGVAA